MLFQKKTKEPPEDLMDMPERTGYLPLLPLLFGMSVGDLILTNSTISWYEGTDWTSSVLLVFMDRHADRYAEAWSNTAEGFMTVLCEVLP